jgi:hypothetical protein
MFKKIIKCKWLDEVKTFYMTHGTNKEGDDMVKSRE